MWLEAPYDFLFLGSSISENLRDNATNILGSLTARNGLTGEEDRVKQAEGVTVIEKERARHLVVGAAIISRLVF